MDTPTATTLSFVEAAERLRISQRTLNRWLTKPDVRAKLTVYRTPTGYRRFRPEEVDQFAREIGAA